VFCCCVACGVGGPTDLGDMSSGTTPSVFDQRNDNGVGRRFFVQTKADSRINFAADQQIHS
jgi:hypothetical protein